TVTNGPHAFVRRCDDRASTKGMTIAVSASAWTTHRSHPRSPHRRTIPASSIFTVERVQMTPTKGTIMTLLQAPPSLRDTTYAAASARGLTKIYSTGDTQVLALDNVDV